MKRLLMIAVLVAACGGGGGPTGSANAQTPTAAGQVTSPPVVTGAPLASAAPLAVASDAPVASEAPPTSAFTAITLKGSGKKVVKFTIPEGATAIAQASYSGSSNFAVTSIAADGSQNELLVNTIGKYKGTVLFDAGAAQHSVAFQVEAAGPWTIVVRPVSSARTWDGTSAVSGAGDDVVQISPASSGLVTLDLNYKGQGNFAVTSYTSDSSSLLANEIGAFSGQVLLPDGSILLTVIAEGTWSATPG